MQGSATPSSSSKGRDENTRVDPDEVEVEEDEPPVKLRKIGGEDEDEECAMPED